MALSVNFVIFLAAISYTKKFAENERRKIELELVAIKILVSLLSKV